MILDKRVYLGLLYDFYGELLTEKQKNVFEGHYLEDLSFGELGELYGISKQAAFDMLRRVEKQLFKYEEKLKLAGKFTVQREAVKEALRLMDKDEKDRVKEILLNILE